MRMSIRLVAVVALVVLSAGTVWGKGPTVRVSIQPSSLTLETNTAFQFVASVKGMGNDRYVVWAATLGQDPESTEPCWDRQIVISDTGIFIAPNFAATCLIHATHVTSGASAIAIVTIVPPPPF